MSVSVRARAEFYHRDDVELFRLDDTPKTELAKVK